MRRFCVLLVLLLILEPLQPAFGEDAQDNTPQKPSDGQGTAVPPETFSDAGHPMPDLVSLEMGSVDFDKGSSSNRYKNDGRTRTTDVRLEYRFGYAILPASGSWMDFGIHPLLGGSVTFREQTYLFGGFAFDWVLFRHLVLTESEAVGIFDSGDVQVAKPMGSFVEFRSQLEIGWRFDNDMRLTFEAGHISNAGLTHTNPGQEIIGGYVHIPASRIVGLFTDK